MKQNLRKLFSGDNGVVEVTSKEELLLKANALISQGRKVIVLDDGSLTKDLGSNEIQGKPGESYCVISVNSIEHLDDMTIPFVNINAMVMIGLGVLYDDVPLFQGSYKAFTGNEAPEGLIAKLTNRILWIIKVLPRIVKLTDELEDERQIRRLFAVAA